MGTILSIGRTRPIPRRATAVAALRILAGWAERARQRRALLTLDDRMLADIGLTRADVRREYDKPFWRA